MQLGLPSGDVAGTLASVVTGLIGVILWLRRRTSRDNAEIHKEKTGSELLDKIMEERDRALAEADRQRKLADEAWNKMRDLGERALRASMQLEACEREESRTQSNLLRAEAELTECRKQNRRLKAALRLLDPQHVDVQGSDFASIEQNKKADDDG